MAKSDFLYYRSDGNSVQCHEEALVEDAKHYFNRDNPSVAKLVSDEKSHDVSAFEVGDAEAEEEYMSPVVSLIFHQSLDISHLISVIRPFQSYHLCRDGFQFKLFIDVNFHIFGFH